MAGSRGVEPHPALHQDPVFKAGRHTNAPALLSIFGTLDETRTRSNTDLNRTRIPIPPPGYGRSPQIRTAFTPVKSRGFTIKVCNLKKTTG